MKYFKKLAVVLFILSLFLLGENAFADMIIGSSGAGWQSWTTSDLNNNGDPYWDNLSRGNGSNKNIGYCLTSNNCGLYNTPPGAIPYWGMVGGGAADSNFYFQGSAGSNDAFTLLLELAGYKNTNIFGWYEIDPVTKAKGNNQIIFNGSDGAGAEKTFPLSQFYGFFFTDQYNGRTYYTQSQYNSSDIGNQHFSIFKKKDDNTFWMGMEDTQLCHSDNDYNDMVLRYIVTPSSVPEPSTLSLIVAGIFGIGILRRFKI